MPKLLFLPSKVEVEVPANTKILAAANKAKVAIVYGCASCLCGTCAVKVKGSVQQPKENEIALLKKMNLPEGQGIRLACQTRVGDDDIEVDLSFQSEYSPDRGLV